MPFASEVCLPAIRHIYDTYTNKLWTTEGFLDSFNVASNNWFASATLAIDEGPIVLMIENYRTGSVWSRMMSSPVIQRGLQRAGFTAPPPDTVTATLISSNQIDVSWSGMSTYQTGYQIQTSANGVNFNVAAMVSSNIYNAIIPCPPGTTCYIRVVTTSPGGISGFRQTVILSSTGAPPAIALTSPIDGSSFFAPATIPFVASVTANGHSITQVNFFNGSTLLGSANTAPYTFTWHNVTAATYNLSAQVVYDTNSIVASSNVTVVITNPPPNTEFNIYEPFNYSVGTSLDGQGGWYLSGSISLGTIETGNLSVPGLAGATGSRFTWPVGNDSVRLPFSTTITNGALYFSFALRVDQIGSFTGHDTFTGLALGTATTYFPKIDVVCNSGNAYQIAIYKGSGTTYGSVASPAFTTNDIVFVVARYTFNTNSTTDDTCDLWVNPDSSTFGAANPPTPILAGIGSGGADAAGSDRITWRGTITGAQKKTVDELRIASSWTAVTPPAPPVLAVRMSGFSAMLSWPTNGSAGFGLEEATQLNATVWMPVTPVIVQGTNNTVSVNTANGQQFFRLVK